VRSLFENWRTGRRGRRLAAGLAALGHQVSVYVPRYRQTKLTDPQTVVRSITIPFDDKYRFCSVVTPGRIRQPGLSFISWIIRHTSTATLSTALPAGDYPDNAERFAMFSRAVLEASKVSGRAAGLPLPRLAIRADSGDAAHALRRGSRVSRSRHRLHHPQHGIPGPVPGRYFAVADAALGPAHHVENGIFRPGEFPERRARYSDYVTTVSKKYSQEIQTTEYGFGLEGVLRNRAATVTGILNGVDYDEWSPQTDKFIAAKYSPQDLSGKAKCKQDLLHAFGIPRT
jgi:starch synthase